MDTLVRNATARFSSRVDGYEPLNPTDDEAVGMSRDGYHSRRISFSRPKSYRHHDHDDDHGGLSLEKFSRPKSYRDHVHGDHGLRSFPRLKSYRNHDHGSRGKFSRPKSYRTHESMMKNSFSYRRDRARKRQIFLQSYKLASMESARKSRTKKLKRVVVKVKSLVVSVLSFIRADSLRSCNSRSAVSAALPTRVVSCC